MRSMASFLLFILAFPLAAEEQARGATDIQRALEMPGHRALMTKITEPGTALSPFETDGCSGGMSWSWQVVADLFPDFEVAQGAEPPWEACCVDHDRLYHAASGTDTADASFAARLAADEALRQCVIAQGEASVSDLAVRYEVTEDQVRLAYRVIGDAMYNAVRFGGGPCSGLPWRWGYGYPGCIPGF